MYTVLSTKPVINLFLAKDKQEFAKSCEFFAMRALVTKRSLYEDLYGWVNIYPIFKSQPLYVSLVRNNFWFKQSEGTWLENHRMFIHHPGIPSWLNKDNTEPSLPQDNRLWNDEKYWKLKCYEPIEKLTRDNDVSEVLLDGEVEPILARR